jgi:hypothetical protein
MKRVGHFQRDYFERQLDRPSTPGAGRTAVVIYDDSDIIVCVGELGGCV